MGRTEKRHELVKGPTIRRGARVGGGVVLLPGIEVGEEAFVGAGAVVIARRAGASADGRQPRAAARARSRDEETC
jgi:acetyltransferase-like isoleucine patch superfamily enzyme